MAAPDRQLKPDTYRSEQNVQNWSFDEIYKVLATIPVVEYNNALYRMQGNQDGSLAVGTTIYDKRLDDTTTLNMIYIGEAVPGTATSAATWRIKRLNIATGLIIEWAANGNLTQVWDNRASLTYN